MNTKIWGDFQIFISVAIRMVLEKTCFQRRFEFIMKMLFIKKIFIYKINFRTVTKVKLQKFKKHNQLYFGIFVFELYCY